MTSPTPDEDPHDPRTTSELDAAIERYLALAEGHPDLQERGRELRLRLRRTGARSATQLVAVGRR